MRVEALGAIGAALLFAAPSFAQTDFGAAGRATTRAKSAMPERTPEDVDFDAGVARQVKLLEFTRHLAVAQADREAQEFAQEVTRYVKLAGFMRRLEEQREAEEAAAFEARVALSSRLQRFVRDLSDKHALAPEPIEWIRGSRSAPSR